MDLTKYIPEKPPNKDLVRYLDAELRKIQRALDSLAFSAEAELALRPKIWQGVFTPILRGAGTAGTYELTTATGIYTRIGNRVWVDLSCTLAASITGGGTSYLQIAGLPFSKIGGTFPQGACHISELDYNTGGASLTSSFITGAASNILYIAQSVDNAASIELPVTVLAPNADIYVSINYITGDAEP